MQKMIVFYQKERCRTGMKRNSTGIIIGLLFILAGFGYAAKAMDWLPHFTIFFDGFWTLFIIIPSLFGLFREDGNKKGCVVGLIIGCLFLLSAQDVFKWSMFMPLLFAVLCITIGIKLIFPKTGDKKQIHTTAEFHSTSDFSNARVDSGKTTKKVHCMAVLSGHDIRVDNQEFTGAELTAILGGISANLKNAIIKENVTIQASTIMGGIDIVLPSYVKVVIDCTPILGEVENLVTTPLGADENTPTVFIKATCVMGGIDIR